MDERYESRESHRRAIDMKHSTVPQSPAAPGGTVSRSVKVEIVEGVATSGPTWGVWIGGREIARCWRRVDAAVIARAIRWLGVAR